MSMSHELERLAELHRQGVLSDTEFAQAKARLLQGQTAASRSPDLPARINSLRRSRQDRWLGGVCGGLEQVSGLAAWIWRLLFLMALVCAGSGFLVYVLMWLLVPEEDQAVPALRT
ncbi:MAG: PspC domain-containing protein [Burkholderiaceae bacterium]|nr:MAG: PspC domain-containing protein [Burkholderiaceae bacterium]